MNLIIKSFPYSIHTPYPNPGILHLGLSYLPYLEYLEVADEHFYSRIDSLERQIIYRK